MDLKNLNDNTIKIGNVKHQTTAGNNIESQYRKNYNTQNQTFKKQTHRNHQKNELKKNELNQNLNFSKNVDKLGKRSNYTPSEFAVLLLILVGQEVELKLNNGKIYRGLFQSLSTKEDNNEQFICIQYCRRILDIFSDELSKPVEEFRLFPLNSINRFITTDENGIPTNFESLSGEIKGGHLEKINSFRTDGEITKNLCDNFERTLQPWISEEPETEIIEDILGEEPDNCWDQFEENFTKFGVKGTFDENLYTTPLNYDEISEEAKKNAESIAMEIENEQKKDHLYYIENRLEKSEDCKNDEEMHFSSVFRDEKQEEKVSNLENSAEKEINEKMNKIDIETKDKQVLHTSGKNLKTNFSFNPNAKEFLPRSIPKNQKVGNTDLGGYAKDKNDVFIPLVGHHLYQDYTNTFYQCYRSDANVYQQLIYENLDNQYGSRILIDEVRDKSLIEGTHFTDIQRVEPNKNFVISHCPPNGGIFVYNGSGIAANHTSDNVKGYPITGSNYNNINPHTVYYLPAKSEAQQNATYYITNEVSQSHWNYHAQSSYYGVNDNSAIYGQYNNYHDQGSSYY